jgi:hypothetical protein
MNKTLILGVLRHVLQLAAGVAVARGWIADSDVETLVGALLSIATVTWYAVERFQVGHDVKVADAVGQMGTAMKGMADAVTIAAMSQPTQALRDAAAELPGAQAAIDRASAAITSTVQGRG